MPHGDTNVMLSSVYTIVYTGEAERLKAWHGVHGPHVAYGPHGALDVHGACCPIRAHGANGAWRACGCIMCIWCTR